MTAINIHEDDEGMRNLYPAQAAGEIQHDVAMARTNASHNNAETGIGWTDSHLIQPPEKGYFAYKIHRRHIINALAPLLPRIKKFEVGFTKNNPLYRLERRAYCYGFGKNLYIKLECKRWYIDSIWYDVKTEDPAELTALRQAFQAINDIIPSVIADYWINETGPIDDTNFLTHYFQQLAD